MTFAILGAIIALSVAYGAMPSRMEVHQRGYRAGAKETEKRIRERLEKEFDARAEELVVQGMDAASTGPVKRAGRKLGRKLG